MSRIDGVTLDEFLGSRELPDTNQVIGDLKDILAQLRGLPPPSNMVSSLYGRPVYCARIPESRDPIGPFPNIGAFHEYLFTIVHAHADHDGLRVLAQKSHTKPHRLYFTHGDLNRDNIIVKNGRIAGIIDWQTAGWLPEYWEYSAAMWTGWRRFRVAQLMKQVFPPYDEEMEVERALWRETDRWT